MSRYEVQFRTSGIVAFSATERAICQHWYDCNNYGPEMPYCDPITGEIVPHKWVKGECLELFKLVKVQSTGEVK
jgi:hypothetical protein